MLRNKRFLLLLLIFSLMVQTISFAVLNPAVAEERTVTLVGDLQDELGGAGEWDPTDPQTVMTPGSDGLYQLSGTLPAGSYEYKVAINGSWDENYGVGGQPNGPNYKLTLERETKVTFTYNDSTHVITVTIPLPEAERPRIVGDIQPDIGAGGEWAPAESTAILTDDDQDNIYTYAVDVPKGKHEFKIVLGNNWDAPAYPEQNFMLNVLSKTRITFYYNHETHDVYTDYDPGVPDGRVQGGHLHHDTWDKLYRTPFGAVPTGDTVKLRLQAKKGDLSGARLMLKNYTSGKTSLLDMTPAGWMEKDGKQIEFWEVSVKAKEKGVYGYKFIVRDGEATKEYGEDNREGHTGTPLDGNASYFQLTVHDEKYKTPDWMKEAVVYQIFPDRFFNGSKKNDNAKQNARGSEPIEHRGWEQLPDNPRLVESEEYDGDGIWSNDFYGGDIQGIEKKLDYIQSLGVNTLYLNPIAHAASNHKYDATDYQEIDPMFGTPEEFREFTRELKKRKMRLILDGVFNHVGDDSIYFDRYGKYETVGAYEYWSRVYDLVNEGVKEEEAKKRVEKELKAEGQKFSPYGFHNWFHIENKKTDGVYPYQAWWGFDSLPEIKSIPGKAVDYDSELNNRPFANYIMYEEDSVAKSWLDRGASGWRLDVANEVDPEFWREFRKELKTGSKSDPLILGEIWDDASQYFLGDLYDSVMNYRFRGALMDYLKNGNASDAADQLRAVQEDYPLEAQQALMNLVGSHDTSRAVFLLGNGTDTYERAEHDPNYNHRLGVERLKLASILQMGYPGAPTIYYGDEAGVTGSKDPDDRRTYPWGKEDKSLIRHYQKIGKVRTDHRHLFAYGDLDYLHTKKDLFVFARTDDKKAALIATNRGNTPQTVELDVADLIINGVSLTDQLDKRCKVTVQDGKVKLTIPAMSGRMLVSDKGAKLKRPKEISKLRASEGDHQVKLSWNGNAKTYHVYRTTVSGGAYQKVATTHDKSITIDQLNNGRPYYFAVTAVDKHGNESAKTELKRGAIPHIKLTDKNTTVQSVTKLDDNMIDLAQKQEVAAEISIAGATDRDQAEGLQAQLQVKEPGKESWTSHSSQYTGQNGEYNRFEARFLPIEPGEYQYRYRFSTNLGRDWFTSDTGTVTYQKGGDDTLPAKSVTLEPPEQESAQVNLSWKLEEPTDPCMVAILRDGRVIDQRFDVEKTTYKDLNVTNGTSYTYEVRVYDQYGNHVTSNKVAVIPDLVTVMVTFKVRLPDYTPQDVKINIPGSRNGWNTGAWEMTRGGAVTNDYEYTIEAREGEVLSYKYVKNNSWDQEGLADHTPNNPNDDDVSYYGYGSTETNLEAVVTNQGGNRMVIEDNVLRWIDQPAVITSHTDGQEVTGDTITLKGNAIKEGVLTVNGEPVPIQDDMSFSHTLRLKDGVNEIKLHIEPSEENRSAIFKNDGEAIAKNTKDITMTIYKK
ncbi:alpha amylase N-terminal ig-like domain-containing protein [Melghirimyces profundicolus]|uniref:alpha amylase N-terminal ig-like domain-containing protein n=1 Tax=Melghirimyces profundicolus TaxID=1242148 RepID=UPI001FE43FFD|nr:alpha amylase N-terminal ig-like domain-containing protein [Melghirimyces profundicolus]